MAKIVIKTPGGGGGTSDHNKLKNLQGGKNTDPKEMYHFTENQHTQLLELIYSENAVIISVAPTFGEKGLSTALTVTYRLSSNDDQLLTASINNGIGNVSADIDSGSKSVSGGSTVDSKTFTIAYTYNRNGVPGSSSKSATYSAYTPQFAGVSKATDYSTYSSISSDLDKFIQAGNSIDKNSSPSDSYIWFISNKSNAKIYDQNDFEQSLGIWNNGSTEFYTKSLVLTLADGVTTSTVYLYRSRNTKTISNFTYKIK